MVIEPTTDESQMLAYPSIALLCYHYLITDLTLHFKCQPRLAKQNTFMENI